MGRHEWLAALMGMAAHGWMKRILPWGPLGKPEYALIQVYGYSMWETGQQYTWLQ